MTSTHTIGQPPFLPIRSFFDVATGDEKPTLRIEEQSAQQAKKETKR